MNQVITREEFLRNIKEAAQYSVLIFPQNPLLVGYLSKHYYMGKQMCWKRDVIVLFEKCDWCGSSRGTKADLNGDDICVACGGPV